MNKLILTLMFLCLPSLAKGTIFSIGLEKNIKIDCEYKFLPSTGLEEKLIAGHIGWIKFEDKSTRFPGITEFRCKIQSSNLGEPTELYLTPLLSYSHDFSLELDGTKLSSDATFFDLSGQKSYHLKLNNNSILTGQYRYHSGLKSYFLFQEESEQNRYQKIVIISGIALMASVFVLLLLNTIVFLTSKLKFLIFHIFYMLAMIYISAYFSGHINIFYDKFSIIGKSHNHFLFFTHFATASLLVFAYLFLNIEKRLPKLKKYYFIIIAYSCSRILLLPLLYNYKIINTISDVSYVFGAFLMIYSSLILYKKTGDKYLLVYLSSWIAIAFGVTLTIVSLRVDFLGQNYKNLFMLSGITLDFYLVSLSVVISINEKRREYIRKIAEFDSMLQNRVVSEKKKFEEERAHFLQEANFSTLSRLAGNIAHEFNNPLAIVMGSANMIKLQIQDLNNIEQEASSAFVSINKSINAIEKSSERMSQSVKLLLASSSNHFVDASHLKALNEIIFEVIKQNKIMIDKHNIEIYQPAKRFALNKIHFRRDHLFKVIQCIFTNAVEHICSNPEDHNWIKFDTLQRDSNLEIQIINSGKKIPKEVLLQVWEPFFSSKPLGQNQGLGLYTAKRLVKENHGELELGTIHENTCFCIRLKLK